MLGHALSVVCVASSAIGAVTFTLGRLRFQRTLPDVLAEQTT
jgi:hypothetical protein